MIDPRAIKNLSFAELWNVFLSWIIAVLEWPLSPEVVFNEMEPIEDLEIIQFLADERCRVIERLLLTPDNDLRLAFSEPCREFCDAIHLGATDPEWWQGQLEPWLKTFLSYAVATVPPNYRRDQILLFPYDGPEPLKGRPPVQSP